MIICEFQTMFQTYFF